MRQLWTAAVVAGVLVGSSAASAQDTAEVSLLPVHSLHVQVPLMPPDLAALTGPDPAQYADMQRWTKEFTDWQRWSSRWLGQREPGWLTTYRERRPKPSPPEWLASRCAAVQDETDAIGSACELLAAWRADDVDPQLLLTAAVLGPPPEKEAHITWWEHLHMDLMWPALQWQSSIYGVLGVHHATTVKGRLQVFTAPGALLMNLPSYNGSRTWKVGVNYGIGFRLFDFSFFGRRPAELYLNLAKTWIVSDTSDLVTGRSFDVGGFSITFKKSP